MEERPNYYAIIPASVRYDDSLTPSEKLFYGEITALTYKTGECWASNNYFANLYNVSTRSITNWIAHLEKNNYIQTEIFYKENTKEIEKRVIKIPMENNFYTYGKKFLEGYRKKELGGIEKNFQENNTSINNTSINNNNNNNSPETGQRIPYEEIIDHLNMRLGTRYRYTTNSTRTLIKARFNEGFTLDDFKTAIDKMCVEWTGNKKMEMYLRPSTLFNGKNFESYLNRKVRKLTTKDLKDHMDFSDF